MHVCTCVYEQVHVHVHTLPPAERALIDAIQSHLVVTPKATPPPPPLRTDDPIAHLALTDARLVCQEYKEFERWRSKWSVWYESHEGVDRITYPNRYS